MPKNCVLTLAVGPEYSKLGELTHPSISAYADKIGADFMVVRESAATTPHWEKINKIYELLNKYERIIYLDTDIIVRDDCPDLFSVVPQNQIGLFNEFPFTRERVFSIEAACKDHGIVLKNWNGAYYNTGVMVISRSQKYLFKKPELESCNYWEQGFFNANIAKILESEGNELSVFNLPYCFNRMTCVDAFTGEDRHASYIVHYAGSPNIDFLSGLVRKDLETWDKSKPLYQFKKHIFIDVQGGLGDQVCAEPVIRFLINRVWKDDDINICTHFPTIFKHLGVPIFTHGEFKPKYDTPYYRVLTFPGPETPMWNYVSNLLCHTVDFVSMACLRRTLPLAEKQLLLPVSQNGLREVNEIFPDVDFSEVVLVHPGRHWESKTFPSHWWESVVLKLHNSGLKVCLIGQDQTSRGTVKINVPAGVLDSRNLLSLDGLIALISKAKTLVSNDSAPVHLAGAFDNNIVLIPTCKHPDHLLPFRHGTQNYKAFSIYKKLMIDQYDTRPTTLYEVKADKNPPGEYIDYLPEPAAVVNKVLEIMNVM